MCWHCHIPCEGQNLADLKTTVITREIRIRYCGVLRTKSRLPVLGRWKEYYWDGATWGFIPTPNWPNCKVRGHSLQGCLHFQHQLQVSGFPETTVSFHSLLEGLTELTENYIHGYSLLLGKVYRLNQPREEMHEAESGSVPCMRFLCSFPVESGHIIFPALVCDMQNTANQGSLPVQCSVFIGVVPSAWLIDCLCGDLSFSVTQTLHPKSHGWSFWHGHPLFLRLLGVLGPPNSPHPKHSL